ncbi:MAG TPA: hypothetical protein VFM01_16850 [Nakamurella sp.]|nr:hypothetical protein [Nakamurella sp.]
MSSSADSSAMSATSAPAPVTTGSPVPAPANYTQPVPALASAEASLEQQMPGMFGLDALGAEVAGDTITIDATSPCSYVLDVIRAGQWSVDMFVSPKGANTSTYAAVLHKGTAAGVLQLSGGANSCQGRITHDETVELSASGALNIKGSGRYLDFYCAGTLDVDSSDGKPTTADLFGAYTIGDRSMLLVGAIPVVKGSHPISLASSDEDDEQLGAAAILLPAKTSGVQVLAHTYGPVLFDLLDQTDANTPVAGLQKYPSYASGPGAKETVTITSTSPVRGTVTATDLAREDGSGKSLSFTVPFTCDI